MDVYTLFKFLHVIAAMAWFGGGAVMLFMATLAMRRRDDAELLTIAGKLGYLGMVWFIPAAGATLLFGLVMATLGGLWGEAWVVLGLAAALVSFVTGHFFLRPKGMSAAQLMQQGRVIEAAANGRRLIGVAQFDYCIIIAVVALMVMKPTWGDILPLAIIAALLAVAAVVLLLPKPMRSVAA